MAQQTLESLARQAAAGDRKASDDFLAQLQTLLQPLDGGMLDKVASCALALRSQRQSESASPQQPGELAAPNGAAAVVPTGVVPLTPELLEWVRQQYTEEELVAGLREVRATGGIGSKELLAVLDAKVERS